MTLRIAAGLIFLGWSLASANLNAAEPDTDFSASAPPSLTRSDASDHPLPEGEGGDTPIKIVTHAASDATWRTSISEQLDASIARLQAAKKEQPSELVGATWGEGVFNPTFESQMTMPMGSGKQNQQTMIAGLLQKRGLPPNLTSVVAVESAFNPLALSPKGARGLWQLMPETARRYGLKVESDEDERTNPLKSTNAAAAYIKDLYTQFRDWPLVLAAYNAGEDRVARAMARTGARDFWTLRRHSALPEETLQYVPAVLTKLGEPLPTLQLQIPSSDNPTGMNDSNKGRVAYASPAVR